MSMNPAERNSAMTFLTEDTEVFSSSARLEAVEVFLESRRVSSLCVVVKVSRTETSDRLFVLGLCRECG